MTTSSRSLSIIGASRIIDWFGSWPTFKDAQILEVHLSSLEDSWLKLRMSEQHGDTTGGASRVALITFYFSGVSRVSFHEFSPEAPISQLQVESGADGFQITWKESATAGTGNITVSELSVGLNTQTQPVSERST
jgi:hypothetical protein